MQNTFSNDKQEEAKISKRINYETSYGEKILCVDNEIEIVIRHFTVSYKEYLRELRDLKQTLK